VYTNAGSANGAQARGGLEQLGRHLGGAANHQRVGVADGFGQFGARRGGQIDHLKRFFRLEDFKRFFRNFVRDKYFHIRFFLANLL
jgi:hypothetical protein